MLDELFQIIGMAAVLITIFGSQISQGQKISELELELEGYNKSVTCKNSDVELES